MPNPIVGFCVMQIPQTTRSAWAANNSCSTTICTNSTQSGVPYGHNCRTSQTVCDGNIGYRSCVTCDRAVSTPDQMIGAELSGCSGVFMTYSTCKCLKGYYSSAEKCVRCPADADGNYGTTAAAGDTTRPTDCYLTRATEYQDDSGSYSYTQNCYYSNG